MSRTRSVTVSFLTLAFARLWHVFNMRDPASPPLDNDVVTNIYVWSALALCTALLLAAVYTPGVSAVLRLTAPGLTGWVLIAAISALPFATGQIIKQKSRAGKN
jgi:Ca2+-transporting ATPase